METLEKIWDVATTIGGGVMRKFERSVTALFGSSNARYVRKLQPKVEAISALESQYQALSDDQLRAKTVEFRRRLSAGETIDDLLVEAFAVCRESGRRFLGMRHYDVQMIGGMILHSGAIAEMVTGEGKTLVATLPAYLNALEGKGVHVVTVNDYLARRDMEWMGPLYMGLGMTVGAIQSGMKSGERQQSYACDITYGTNNEFGFDYLRDNMRIAARGDDRFPKQEQQAQGRLHYAIVDEVDNILIDEARTPLIISGPADDDITKYQRADKIALQLKRDLHFEVKEKEHSVHLTEQGVREAEKLAGVESFYTAGNMQWPHLIDNSLKAHYLYKHDVNYVVLDGEVIIVDEFTGRLMHGRQWSDGLHQAVEAKEKVEIKKENQTLATITLQNFFKLYDKISGMTGTAMTEAGEFWKIYQLDVIAVPTNRKLQRKENHDVIYRSEHEKYQAIAEEIERMNKHDTVFLKDGSYGELVREGADSVEVRFDQNTESVPKAKVASIEKQGRPILVGTVSIEKSERLSGLLNRRGVKHEVLNAKHHKREAEIVAQAGRKSAVTIATNMAGRGTDIILGGNPETLAWARLQDKYPTRLDVPRAEWDALVHEIEQREQMKAQGAEVKELGGLHIIGTERHEARRIDLQLRGRCGRQGDPGSSRFYLSLEDDLMRIFAGEWVKNILTRLGMKDGEAIESRMVSRRIEGAQKKREEYNFEIRKNLLEYDEVMDEQRKRVYGYRQRILDGVNCRTLIGEMIDNQIDRHLGEFLDPHYGAASFAAAAGERLGAELEARDFRGADFEAADRLAKEEAESQSERQLLDAIEENLPEGDDDSEWNWAALAKVFNVRWRLNVHDRDLKRIGREQLGEEFLERVRQSLHDVDLRECARFLEPNYGLQSAAAWMKNKFGLEMDAAALVGLEPAKVLARAHELSRDAYDRREAEYPVLALLYHCAQQDANGLRIDREKLVQSARARFNVDLSQDDLRGKQRDEIRALLVEQSQQNCARAEAAHEEAERQVQEIFKGAAPTATARSVGANGEMSVLSGWLARELEYQVPEEELFRLSRGELEQRLDSAVEDRFRPEMRRMERMLLLRILDETWKDHLQVMDHLRNSVGLRSYAQVDPKVEFKREGMRLFDDMWKSVGDVVTNLIFKMEQLDETFVSSTWQEAEAVHEEFTPGSASQQQQAIDNSEQANRRLEPIRNQGERVGRNDPCPCGSGKKYKQCCLRRGG